MGNEKLVARGRLESELGGAPNFLRLGTATFSDDMSYVLVPTLAKIAQGTRNPSPPFDGYVDFNSGSAGIYGLNPVVFGAVGQSFPFVGGTARFFDRLLVGFDDFAIFEDETEPINDPIDGVVLSGNEGTMSGGAMQDWVRHHKVFIPPKRAAFVIAAPRFNGMPAGNIQYLDSIQMEKLGPADTGPTAFTPAREIRCKVRPTRLNFSTNVSLNATGNSHTYSVDHLIPGRSYIHSILVTKDVNFELTGAQKVSTGYTDDDRAWVVFEAEDDTVGFTVTGSSVNVSKPLTEQGSVALPYFDGGSGSDYLWEQGGTPGSTRSYYYEDRDDRHYVLVRTLRENVPVGVPVASPEYASGPPTS